MQRRNTYLHLMRTSRIPKTLRESVLTPRPSRILPCLLPHTHSSLEESQNFGESRGLRLFYLDRGGGGDRRRGFAIHSSRALRDFLLVNCSREVGSISFDSYYRYSCRQDFSSRVAEVKKTEIDDPSQRAVTTALWANFLVFSLKFGVWLVSSSHVMLAEVIHSVADFANQALLAYGLSSSRRAPDALHPYGYSKERFVWSLISAVGIFCLGSGATIVHGFQNLWISEPPTNIQYAALVIGGSFIIEGGSLVVAIHAVRKGAAAEGMKMWDYVWRGHDPTSVAVMTEDGAAVTGLAIAAASLVAVNTTGNAIYDPIGSIVVGNLLGMVKFFVV